MRGSGSTAPAGRGRVVALPLLAALVVAVAVGAAAVRRAGAEALADPVASVDAASVVLTLIGMALGLSLIYLVWALLTGDRGHNSAAPAEKRAPIPLRVQLLICGICLAILGGIVLLIVFSHPITGHAGGASGNAPPLRLPPRSTPIAYSSTVGGLTAGAVVLVVLALFVLSRLRRGRRSRGTALFTHLDGPDQMDPFAPADSMVLPLEEVTVPDPATEPDPRRAVIAAWLSMTEVIGRHWRARDPSETPFEYVAAALTGAGVRPDSAHRLTTLFETARYGGRPVGEETRAEAVAALDAVRADLQRREPLVGAT